VLCVFQNLGYVSVLIFQYIAKLTKILLEALEVITSKWKLPLVIKVSILGIMHVFALFSACRFLQVGKDFIYFIDIPICELLKFFEFH